MPMDKQHGNNQREGKRGEGESEKKRSLPRRANGFVAGFLVVFFFLAHSLLGSLSLVAPISNNFAWIAWIGTSVVAVHVVLSVLTTREKLTQADKEPTLKKKLKIAARWATGLAIAAVAGLHITSIVLYGDSAVQSTQVGNVAVLVLVVLLAVHVFLGIKSLVRDLGASKEQKDQLKTPLRVAVCLVAAVYFATVLLSSL